MALVLWLSQCAREGGDQSDFEDCVNLMVTEREMEGKKEGIKKVVTEKQ